LWEAHVLEKVADKKRKGLISSPPPVPRQTVDRLYGSDFLSFEERIEVR
jgi:hypothetical protein